jgi:hypothetical protein
VQRIEQLHRREEWIGYNLVVPELDVQINVVLPLHIESENLVIGILGSSSGHSTGILLNSLQIGSQRYKRMTTKDAIILPSPSEQKAPDVIFIE